MITYRMQSTILRFAYRLCCDLIILQGETLSQQLMETFENVAKTVLRTMISGHRVTRIETNSSVMVLSKNHAQWIFDHIYQLNADDDHDVGSIVHLKNMTGAELDDHPDYLLQIQVCNVFQMTALSLPFMVSCSRVLLIINNN